MEFKFFYQDPLKDPIPKGSLRKLATIKPEEGKYIVGLYCMCTSKYMVISAIQQYRERTWVPFAAWPKFLNQYGEYNYAGFNVFLTRYDEVNNIYCLQWVPDRPVPIHERLDFFAIMGWPEGFPWTFTGAILPRLPDPVKRTWEEIEDDYGYVNHIGIATISIVDLDEFLDSIAKLIIRLWIHLIFNMSDIIKNMFMRK